MRRHKRWNSPCLRLVCGACLLLGSVALAGAQDWPVRQDVQSLFSRQSATVGLLGLGLAGLASPLDDDVRGRVADNALLDLVFDVDRLGGSSTNSLAATFTVWGLASIGNRPRLRTVSAELFRALVLSNSLVFPLKELVHRQRPDQRDHRSFPSGHSANSFAMATVLTRHYGWRLGMPIFAFAATVPTSRIHEGRHHLSDVVAGATLGTISGLAVSMSKPGAQEGVVWMPTHSRGVWQLRAQWRY